MCFRTKWHQCWEYFRTKCQVLCLQWGRCMSHYMAQQSVFWKNSIWAGRIGSIIIFLWCTWGQKCKIEKRKNENYLKGAKQEKKNLLFSTHKPPHPTSIPTTLNTRRYQLLNPQKYLVIYRMHRITFNLLGGEECTSNLSIPEELCQNNHSLCY
jgi:hypothetical protein